MVLIAAPGALAGHPWTRRRSLPIPASQAGLRANIGSAPTCWGRDVYSRVIYGFHASRSRSEFAVARVSRSPRGLAIGLVHRLSSAGLDAIVMRVMDGLMSIPSVLLRHCADGADEGKCRQTSSSPSRSPKLPRVRAPGARPGAQACANSRMWKLRSPAGDQFYRSSCCAHILSQTTVAPPAGAGHLHLRPRP